MIAQAKYADICTGTQKAARAEAMALIVLTGKDGSGFSVQAEPGLQRTAGSHRVNQLSPNRSLAPEWESESCP